MTVRKRPGAKTGATLLAAGLTAGAMVALPAQADAAARNGLTGLAGSCATTGTVTITAGGLSMGGPGTLTWAANIIGAAQTVTDTAASDEIL